VWRVLSQTETDQAKKNEWHEKVLNAFGDLKGPDRLHAAETLAKMRQSPLAKYPEATQESLHDTSRNMQVYTQWAVSYAPDADTNKVRQHFLQLLAADSNQIVRMISAYILRKNKGLTQGEWAKLAAEALAEPGESQLKHNLLNTAIATFPKGMKKTEVYDEIAKESRRDYLKFSVDQRIQLSQALAEVGEAKDIPLLTSYLNNENSSGIYGTETKEGADVRAAAAYAILNIKERTDSK
jgi:HEAT repeat protein